MEKKEILVSVGLPVYNGGKFIEEALDSVLEQTHTNFELIISDNGSTDNTEAICRKYQKKDSRIKYIRHEQNLGGVFNFDYCVKKAVGKYFTFLAYDDLLNKNFLEITLDYLFYHKECVLVAGDYELIDQFGIHIENFTLDRTRENVSWRERRRQFFKYPTSSKIYFFGYGLYKTDIVKRVYADKFRTKMFKGSDMASLCRIATLGEMVSIPTILRKFRIHENSSVKIEMSKLNKKPLLIKRLILFTNVCEVRFDQARVLIKSCLPINEKIRILSFVYFQYFKSFLSRILNLPKKISSLLKN
ncbi:MAG: hypothetical protein A3A96_01035 [Candidatus Zambryskibacteria bacterium RIFCSPLOWO2_01_FULL_39_39]|uniref:Glycosyltransferase 2-like domain-containing protein n=1 Tax=Candidatus Zambryskibacteria bacterium RIFCSPLOWO2_01_FULL_39_39 TaxID=1802758 RepID=A0A1G2U0S8_9BACT|nr:MAG: Glycosyl transferase family 2 [Parcubacteria group bacterium GW2011_GWA1_38_7]OHA87544.1 MAG: hypothetical protein A2644_04345 [Candidatus Zambryskibacteria bacterium RIFCSPHIGHO2_01_FULL_39_63]OHA95072.1 MAG: hypothetical protein A3B88_03255 [Candidatus Zambryskibacteria bacterium RIFCSPHIGHO2_02_FULL_39_19]OHA98192.1 MAG: hypothetical protein A3F20_04065 [Candidatus Zambryskibacteria bacterium RIFCSPHIGHO2_12_FULL_39_21]OHB02442.1 MAG: hypothetical protein A3A96_01035 [Candidatus Zamb